MCWGVGGGRRDVGRGMKGGVGKCNGVWGGGVRGNVGKGEGRDMWGIKSVLGPHTSTHFPTSSPLPCPHPFPTRQHTSPLTPYTFPHPPLTSFLTSPHTPTHFPTSIIIIIIQPIQHRGATETKKETVCCDSIKVTVS